MSVTNTFELTVPGRIMALRNALREAGHPDVDEFTNEYLQYAAELCGTIEGAVTTLERMEADGVEYGTVTNNR